MCIRDRAERCCYETAECLYFNILVLQCCSLVITATADVAYSRIIVLFVTLSLFLCIYFLCLYSIMLSFYVLTVLYRAVINIIYSAILFRDAPIRPIIGWPIIGA